MAIVDLVLDHLRTTGAGLTYTQLSAALGIDRKRVSSACGRLVERKLAAYVADGRSSLYYAAEHAPAGAMTEIKPKARKVSPAPGITISHARIKPPTGEVIVPAGVKVTICPSGQDQRFTFHPPKGWRGQITRDWMERKRVR